MSPANAYSQNPKLHVGREPLHSEGPLQRLQSGSVVPGDAASNAQPHFVEGLMGVSGAPSRERVTFIAHCGTLPTFFSAPKRSTEGTGD